MLADRVFAVILLLLASLVPSKALFLVTVAEVQLILGTLVVLYLLLRDPMAGLLMGLALLMAYLRAYRAKYGITWNPFQKDTYPMASLVSDYITPQHLKDAQSNVVDEASYSTELKGIQGVYGEEVYGAQGLDAAMPGWGEIPRGEEVRRANE